MPTVTLPFCAMSLRPNKELGLNRKNRLFRAAKRTQCLSRWSSYSTAVRIYLQMANVEIVIPWDSANVLKNVFGRYISSHTSMSHPCLAFSTFVSMDLTVSDTFVISRIINALKISSGLGFDGTNCKVLKGTAVYNLHFLTVAGRRLIAFRLDDFWSDSTS